MDRETAKLRGDEALISLHHRLLGWAYHPLKAAHAVERRLGVSAGNRLRVLLFHDIAPEEEARLASQLRWLARSWSFVTPARFEAMLAGEEPVIGKQLLVTFDDGFASNRAVAERVLNPMRICALFFAVSDFVALNDREEARRFIAARVQPGSRADDLPSHWSNMTWADLEALLEQGHTIGAHTRTHARLSATKTSGGLHDEIVVSGNTIAARLGIGVRHFAYTFGDLASITRDALEIAAGRYAFVHSGIRGNNRAGASPFAIRRESAAMQDPKSNYHVFPDTVLGAMLEGAADFRYCRARAQLDEWAGSLGRATMAKACNDEGSAC